MILQDLCRSVDQMRPVNYQKSGPLLYLEVTPFRWQPCPTVSSLEKWPNANSCLIQLLASHFFSLWLWPCPGATDWNMGWSQDWSLESYYRCRVENPDSRFTLSSDKDTIAHPLSIPCQLLSVWTREGPSPQAPSLSCPLHSDSSPSWANSPLSSDYQE